MEQFDENSFQHLAFQKMIHMNFSYLMSLISSYKTLNMIHPNNPLYQYLCYFTPYRPKINEKERKLLFQSNQNYASMTNAVRNLKKFQNSNQQIYKDEIIQFNLQLSKGLQRFQKYEINSRNKGFNEQVILIQKHIRSFLKRISVIRIIDSIIIEKCLQYIIKIQREFKKFKFRRDFKVNHLIQKILNYREEKSDIIKNLFYTYETRVNIRNNMLINEFLNQREKSCILIQNVWRNTKFREDILKIIHDEKTKYTLIYPFYAKYVRIKVFLDKKMKISNTYNYKICPIRKIHVVHINYSDFPSGRYYCQLFVDNYLSSDERFPQVQGKDGNYYNLIDFYQNGGSNSNDSYNNLNNLNNSVNLTGVSSSNHIDNIETVNSNNNLKYTYSGFNNNNNNNFNNNSNNGSYNSLNSNHSGFNKKYSFQHSNTLNNYQHFNNFDNNNNNNFFNNLGYNNMNPFNNFNIGNNNYRKLSTNEEMFFSLKKNLAN